jgi:D-amino-acid oxidase
VVLGGTEVAGDWSAEPDPATAGRILRDCATVDPRLASARIIEHRVGFRPARPQVRLEAGEAVAADGTSQRLLVHNYGHGGAGVTLSWGCAREVAGLVGRLA